jgi:hypothetical protein
MRLYLQVPAIILFGYLFELFLPWYSVAFVAFVFGYILNSESNFVGGFLGVALLWAIKILLITNSASVDLADKVAQIMDPIKEKWILIVVTLVLGGLVGGFACMTGGSLHRSRSADYSS